MRARRPRLPLLIAVALAALPAAWYLASRAETVEPEEMPSAVGLGFQSGDAASIGEERPQTRGKTFYGLQTTVPDTLGYDEKTAAFALEEGGFRVRVMNRQVSDPRQEGIIVQQLPRGGVTRRVNWIVTIVVGIIK